ncbi:MAG: alanine--tRNA ligase [Bacteroidota bacterium]|nr:alanine--tRNA ligase [Bacteroidota bacterium]
MKTSNEIRNDFINFFEERGHKFVPSSPVVPYDDPTLLFTNAGMNQFKDVFLEIGKRDYTRAVNSQKCIRVSGKHNDLEEVGRDTYHHTLFEMLGNWSFGDPARPAGGYYKKEAIEWAWELLTKVWKLDKKRLYASVFETDSEAEELWNKVTDINPSHVLRFGKKDNFWEMGETGPCGPCSEIHIDLSEKGDCGHLVNAGDPRVMEIWNLVFIQYNRDDKGTLTPLPAKHVDTGMGFERICAVLQGKKSNYDTDVFTPILKHISKLVGKPYQSKLDDPIDIAMRVIADHVRMLSFSIADGGMPSNEGRGYVMRRILRRAARFGRSLEMHEPFIYKIVEAVVQSMGNQYPEIKERQNHIERVIKGEEESFNITLDRGLEIFETVIEEIGHSKTFPGEDAFKLYDTFGFPLDLTEMIAAERGLKVDTGRFAELMDEQRSRARDAVKSSTQIAHIGNEFNDSSFIGYDKNEADVLLDKVIDDKYISFNETPFYIESGGQVDDTGIVEGKGFRARILKSIKQDKKLIHEIEILEGNITDNIGKIVHVKVDYNRRQNIMRNHTATHLLHEALRRVLGSHVQQHGSLVAPDRLRFDFNHFEKVTEEQIHEIKNIVNKKISEGISVESTEMPIEGAKKIPGIKMFFGEKYGDVVRVIKMADNFSAELCGGTHVKNTSDIGFFKIISEASIASGIRRIEAVTGEGVKLYIEDQIDKILNIDDNLEILLKEKESSEKELSQYKKVEPSKPPPLGIVPTSIQTVNNDFVNEVESLLQQRELAVEQINKEISDLKKELSKHRVQEASSGIDALVDGGVEFDGFKIVFSKIEASSMDELKNIGDTLRAKLTSGVGVLGTVIDEKVALVCVVTDDLIKNKKLQAGKIVSEVAKITGGSGGGRPHLATAGGKDVNKLDEALEKTVDIIKAMIA